MPVDQLLTPQHIVSRKQHPHWNSRREKHLPVSCSILVGQRGQLTTGYAGIQAGGVLVDLECRWYLTKLLRSAGLDEEDVKEYADAGVKDFELTTKKEFQSPEATHYINFRDTRFTESSIGIRRGKMALDG